MKYIVVILDGAAGWPLDDFGGKTTLEAACTVNLDLMAQQGTVGLSHTVPFGTEPSSSAACMSILGYDPVEDYIGRGAIEAASMGITLQPDEVALRLNLVNVSGGIMTSYSSGGIQTEEARAVIADLAESLDDETFQLHAGIAYRHILVVKGHPELMEATYTPPHDISDKPVQGHLPEGPGSELLIGYMDRARPIIENSAVNRCRQDEGLLPATDVWPFWPGTAPGALKPFSEKYGVSAAMTSGVDLLNGLAVLTGISRIDIDGVTSGSDNDYAAQAEGALAALDDHDLVVIHIESPDEEGHAGNAAGKVEAIEWIDRAVISRIRGFSGDVRVLAMPDHPTPVALKTHVGEPVPFLIWGPGVESNGARSYDEIAARNTGLSLDPGRLVMDRLLGE